MPYSIAALIVFRKEDERDTIPLTTDEIAKAINAALLRLGGGWSIYYSEPEKPVPAPVPFKSWRVVAAIVNLRSGPGTTYGIKGQVKAGEVLEQINDRIGWIESSRGWVNSALLQEVKT